MVNFTLLRKHWFQYIGNLFERFIQVKVEFTPSSVLVPTAIEMRTRDFVDVVLALGSKADFRKIQLFRNKYGNPDSLHGKSVVDKSFSISLLVAKSILFLL